MAIDTEQFLNMTTDDALDTRVTPCPAGEFPALLEDFQLKDFNKSDGGTGYRLIVKWEIQDEGVRSELGRDTVTVSQNIFLDMNDDGTALDMSKGKNIGLGRLREALGQNEPGKPWSPAMLKGQIASLSIKHEVYEGNVQARVEAVRAA